MKPILVFLLWSVSVMLLGQSRLPLHLVGTWKVNGLDSYEHWDQLDESSMKGFSYEIRNGQMIVSEYLEIRQKKGKVTYTAAVRDQNQGKPIPFLMRQQHDTLIFENLNHDFPKRISYIKVSENKINVHLSDLQEKASTYTIVKQVVTHTEKNTTAANINYDRVLAEKLGGDDYGMKKYILVLLRTGSNKTTDKAYIAECFRGHLNNINLLVDQGKLIVAGPLGKNDQQYRGIFILTNINTLEQARELLQTDPAIKSGLLDLELFDWYGSAALPEYLPLSDKIWRLRP